MDEPFDLTRLAERQIAESLDLIECSGGALSGWRFRLSKSATADPEYLEAMIADGQAIRGYPTGRLTADGQAHIYEFDLGGQSA